MKLLSGKLLSIIRSHNESIGLFNSINVDKRIKCWNEYMKVIEPYYAIKSLNHPYMLKHIMNNGYNFDIASMGELYQLKSLGCSSQRMILANPSRSLEDINIANKLNVKYIVCDDYESLKYILSLKSDMKIIWRIQSCEEKSLIKFNNKFGASIEDTMKVITKNNNMIYGLSFHVGSGCNDMQSFSNTLDIIKKEIFPYWNGNCKLIDIGGGMKDINDIINLSNVLKPYFIDDSMKYIKWIAEPGRYFSSDSIDLYTKIIRVKCIDRHYHVYINDSIYNSFSGKIFDHQLHYPVNVYPLYKNTELVKATIWGCTCDSLDMIIDNIFIDRPAVGNILKWSNMGSYSMVSASDSFNGFKKSKIIII
jgi:ornithine decarboxylase